MKHMRKMGMEARGGRSRVAPNLVRSADKHEDMVVGEQVDSLEIGAESDGDVEVGGNIEGDESVEFDKGDEGSSAMPYGTPQRRG